MRRTVLLLAGVLLSIVALGLDSPKEYDDRTEVAGIEGTWRLAEIEFGDEKLKPSNQDLRAIHGGAFSETTNESETVHGIYHIDATHKPAYLDWMPLSGSDKGKTYKLICQIDGDTLRIAGILSSGGEHRPQRFNGAAVIVAVYKRVK